jgi:uncharacterized protein YijF (DUF1287 family)
MKLNLPILFAIFMIRHANSVSFHAFEKTPQQWQLISQENISHQRRYKQQNLCEYNQENQEKTEKPEKYNLWLPFILVWRIILILFLFFV